MANNFRGLESDVRGFGERFSAYLEAKKVELEQQAAALKVEIDQIQEAIKGYVFRWRFAFSTDRDMPNSWNEKAQLRFVLYIGSANCSHRLSPLCWLSAPALPLGCGLKISFPPR